MIITKFGGSSLASSAQFKKVKSIVTADKRRTVVVVSAPGKRFPGDNKLTDLLYILHGHLKYGVSDDGIWESVAARYREIAESLQIGDIDRLLREFASTLSKNTDLNFLVSRGEYFCARLMSEYLGYAFVDAADILRFSFDGSLQLEESEKRTREAYESRGPMVVPGFYGAYPNGDICLFPRGGSDVSGAYLARFLQAETYENWTDVSGICAADPRIVKNPKTMEKITYEELRELSYMGAGVLHDESILPVQERGIDIFLKNTEKPTRPGTCITKDAGDGTPVTGIAGKKGFVSFTIHKKHMSSEVGFLRRVLSVFEKYGVNIEHTPTGMDSISVIVSEEQAAKPLYAIISEIEEMQGARVKLEKGLSLLAIVGRNMVGHSGICAAIFSILGKEKINVRMLAQAPEEVTVIVGIPEIDHERAIAALYEGLCEENLL